MKKQFYILLLIPILTFGQSQDQNYIKTTTYKQATLSAISDPDIDIANVNIRYFDGLGRPIQQIAHKQSATGKDILTHIEYDTFGRQIKDYLPYVNQNPSKNYDLNAQSNLLNYYSSSINTNFETTDYPYSEKQFENSPLNRVLKQASPGLNWKIGNGHEIKFDYEINSISDEVFRFETNRSYNSTLNSYDYSLNCIGYYDAGTLNKSITKNENWISGVNNTTEEYTDNLGKVILKRAYNNNQKYDTYYIYDKIGNLIYVIPPLPSDSIASVTSSQEPITTFLQSFNYSTFLIDSNGDPTVGGGNMTLKIENNTISLIFNAGFSTATFDLTVQHQINTSVSIPDMTLGYIDFYYGGNHQFIAKIQNNKLFFEDYTPNDPTFYFTSLNQTLSQPLAINLGYQTIYTYTTNTNVLEPLCYQYKYDYRNRLVEKKLPGKQEEFIIYDKLDRVVATGPVNTPYGGTTMGWMITEYDVFGRVTQTGWKQMTVDATTRNTNQQSINNSSNPFVLSTNDVLTKNYYDNYSFPEAPTVPTSLPESNFPLATNVKGLPTGTWTKVLDPANTAAYELSYTLYDNKYRPVRSYTKNYLGGYTQVDSNIDWAGKTLYTITKHKRMDTNTELTVKDMFSYSDQDRLLIHKQQINSDAEQLITSNTYDELGQLISKKVGGTDVSGATGLQKIDYNYNIRGWLKGINDIDDIVTENDLFAFKINYNDPETAQPLFNGNIAETLWKTSADNKERKYNYTYDHLNRLLQADYAKNGSVSFNSYLETMTYDKNGNILTLFRNGDNDTDGLTTVNNIDNLTYTYDTNNKNQLLKVFDTSSNPQGFKDNTDGITDTTTDDYSYDANGNLIRDDNKGITLIEYNHLNLPTKITFGTNGFIEYLYNALGQKVKKMVLDPNAPSGDIGAPLGVITDYLSGFQYKNGVLQFFPHAEGYVNATESGAVFGGGITYSFNYVYNYTDHLGNIRLSYSVDPASQELKIMEENHYYPFGLKHTNYNSDWLIYGRQNESTVLKKPGPIVKYEPVYKYKFNGTELQDELGLDMYAMDMRQYDPSIARWVVQDPVVHHSMSPYSAFDNNPVFWADPSGADSETDMYGRNRFDNNGMYIPPSDRVTANSNSENYSSENSQNTNSITHEEIINLFNSAEKNSASFFFFDDTPGFVAVMNVYNTIMNLSMLNEAATIVFGNDVQKLRENLITISISTIETNKITGDKTSFLLGNVKFDNNYNVIGKGGSDFFINYSTNTTVLKSKKDGYIGKDPKTGKSMYDNTKTWGLGQDTFTSGHYAVSFSSQKHRGASGYNLNFVGFRTNELRIKYVEYWRKKIDEYVKIFKANR